MSSLNPDSSDAAVYAVNFESLIGDDDIELGTVMALSRFAVICARGGRLPDFKAVDQAQAEGDAFMRDLFRIKELPTL